MAVQIENKFVNLSYKLVGQFEETRFEKIHNVIFKNAEERNRDTTQKYNALDLTDYATMEAFRIYQF